MVILGSCSNAVCEQFAVCKFCNLPLRIETGSNAAFIAQKNNMVEGPGLLEGYMGLFYVKMGSAGIPAYTP